MCFDIDIDILYFLLLTVCVFFLLYFCLSMREKINKKPKRNKSSQMLLIKPVFSKNFNKAALIWRPFNKYFIIIISYSPFFLNSSNNYSLSFTMHDDMFKRFTSSTPITETCWMLRYERL